jgi:hypothetical protein
LGFIFCRKPLNPFFFSVCCSTGISGGSELIICDKREVLIDLLSCFDDLSRSLGSPTIDDVRDSRLKKFGREGEARETARG